MKISAKYASRTAVLAAAAVALGFAESCLPPVVPIPGVKIGLGNMAVLIALYCVGVPCTISVALIKPILCALLFSGFSGLIYSFSGAAASLAAMLLLKKTDKFSVVGISCAGGIFHNIGQLAAAYLMLGKGALGYFPILTGIGAAVGIVTGIGADIVIRKGEVVFGKK